MENVFEPVTQTSEAATRAIELKGKETIKAVLEMEDGTKSSEDKIMDDSHFVVRPLPVWLISLQEVLKVYFDCHEILSHQ